MTASGFAGNGAKVHPCSEAESCFESDNCFDSLRYEVSAKRSAETPGDHRLNACATLTHFGGECYEEGPWRRTPGGVKSKKQLAPELVLYEHEFIFIWIDGSFYSASESGSLPPSPSGYLVSVSSMLATCPEQLSSLRLASGLSLGSCDESAGGGRFPQSGGRLPRSLFCCPHCYLIPSPAHSSPPSFRT